MAGLSRVVFALVGWRYYFYDFKYRLAQRFGGVVFRSLYYIFYLFDSKKALDALMASHRANYNLWAEAKLKASLVEIGETYFSPNKGGRIEDLSRCLVLKKPVFLGGKLKLKGVLLIKFTETFATVLAQMDCAKLVKDYFVVLEPSWSGYAVPEILAWCRYSTELVYIQSAERKDFDFIEELDSNLVPVARGSGDWVDYRLFKTLNHEKIYDSVCVANYNEIKRLHKYIQFIVLAVKNNSCFRAALVCAGWGRLRGVVLRLLDVSGVRESVDLYESLPPDEVNLIVSQSKVNFLFSLREGSNRSLFEGMIAGTPGLVLRANIGVNKELFDSKLGRVFDESDALHAYQDILSQGYSPSEVREEALKRISPEQSMKCILGVIQEHERLDSPIEQVDLKVNVPEAAYMHDISELDFADRKVMLRSYAN